MDTALLTGKFTRIGARLKVVDRPASRFNNPDNRLVFDIASDRRGEYFEITRPGGVDPSVEPLDVQPAVQHLLLLVRELDEKSKYLCGMDERHWFVAAVPESAPVGTVRQAWEALKPREVRNAQAVRKVSGKARHRRKNAAFRRQGEWFFLPVVNMTVPDELVLHNEPLRRSGGKAHWAQYCYRTGGESVYVCSRYPNGVVADQYHKILSGNGRAKNWGWVSMRRNPGVYVCGRIRHPDHATVNLHGWHQVIMNTESQSRAMRHVAFLD
ncbi:MAG: hypothetical protein ACR2NP_03615 [Pirellulaceae bacterium]